MAILLCSLCKPSVWEPSFGSWCCLPLCVCVCVRVVHRSVLCLVFAPVLVPSPLQCIFIQFLRHVSVSVLRLVNELINWLVVKSRCSCLSIPCTNLCVVCWEVEIIFFLGLHKFQTDVTSEKDESWIGKTVGVCHVFAVGLGAPSLSPSLLFRDESTSCEIYPSFTILFSSGYCFWRGEDYEWRVLTKSKIAVAPRPSVQRLLFFLANLYTVSCTALGSMSREKINATGVRASINQSPDTHVCARHYGTPDVWS